MGAGRRSLLLAAMGAALALPAAASAAPVVTGTAVPGVPQDCQAGCIGSLKLQCTATDALSVRTTVSCWIRDYSYNKLTAWQDLPTAFVQGTVYNPIFRSYTLCVEGTAVYRDGTSATTLQCLPGPGLAMA